jgi:2,5-diketo-D-gluconate reductase A
MTDESLQAVLPQIGFGTYLIPDDEVELACYTALKVGYRHLDTAEWYKNEAGIGRTITRAKSTLGLDRRDIFVTTKLWPGNPQRGMETKDYAGTVAAFDASLQRLELDYVDLYLIHAPFAIDERLDQWRACCDMKKAGKARFVGLANYRESHIAEIENAGLPLPDANQIELHPWFQRPELISFLRRKNISIIAYSSLLPLANWRGKPGQNSGKPDDMKLEGMALDSPFKMMAAKHSVTEAQLLLKWGLQKGYAVLPKTVDESRMRENLDLQHFTIDDQDIAAFDVMDRGDGVAWHAGDPSSGL